MKINRLILGSTSKFRAQMLATTGLEFEQMPATIDEDDVQDDLPRLLAKKRAEAKALSVEASSPEMVSLVIGADQVLEFDSKAFGKAHSEQEAMERLKLFSGKKHQLISAVALGLFCQGKKPKIVASFQVTADMQMRELGEAEIANYLKTQEWRGCAGCYQYENRGIHLFDRVEGSSSTIVGLPLLELVGELRKVGINFLN